MLDLPGAGGKRLQALEVCRRIEQAVGMVDPDAGDVPALEPVEEQGVRRLEHLRVLDAKAREIVDVEEPAVIDLVRRRPPVRQAVRLRLEQDVQRVEARGPCQARR